MGAKVARKRVFRNEGALGVRRVKNGKKQES